MDFRENNELGKFHWWVKVSNSDNMGANKH